MPHCNKKMLSFFLTTKCNLCCYYCYNAKERNKLEEQTIPLTIAYAGIDWYFLHNESRHIRFYGPGEPTQEFAKLKAITEYAKRHADGGERVTVEIQTNGVFDEDIRSWISNNVDIVWISFDGTKDIQDHNRPLNPRYSSLYNGKSSSDIIEDNIKWMNENRTKKDIMVGARVTITDDNVDRQLEMVDYFYSLGIRYVWTNPLFYEVGEIPVCQDEKKKRNYHFNMQKYIEQYLDAYKYAKGKNMFWGSFLTINFDGESYYHCRSCTPLEAPHITPDGYISACDMVVLGSKPFHMDCFIVGKWNENRKEFDFFERKIHLLNERKSTKIAHCKSCPAQLHCGGYCLGEIVNETGKLDGQDTIKCFAVKALFNSLGTCEPYDYLHP